MRRIWRVCKWLLAGLLVLLAGVVVLNSFDEAPSPEALAMGREPEATLTRQQNMYYALMGFYTTAGADMEEAGWNWVRVMLAAHRDGKPMMQLEREAKPPRYQFVGDTKQLPGYEHVPSDLPGLVKLLQQHEAETMRLATDNQVLLDRYAALERYPHFAVTAPLNVMMVGELEWEGPMMARRLWKLELADLLLHGHADEATEMLRHDVVLWRRQLAEPQASTMSKLMMCSTLMNDFQLASQLARAGASPQQLASLQALAAPLTSQEMSMAGALAREFRFEQDFAATVDKSTKELEGEAEGLGISKWRFRWRRVEWQVQRLFYLPQATANLAAARMQAAIDADAQPCERYQSTANVPSTASETSITWLRNPVGKSMMESPSPFGFYTGRMCQLLGFQRVLALQVLLRQRGVPDAQIADFVHSAGPDYADPFTGAPMQWLPQQRALSFTTVDQRGKEMLPWPI